MSIKKIYNLLICIICLLTLKLNSLFQIKIFAEQNMSASGSFCGDITTFMAMQWLCNDFRNDVKACLSTLRYYCRTGKIISNSVPRPSSLPARIVPPCRLTIVSASDNPKPRPF